MKLSTISIAFILHTTDAFAPNANRHIKSSLTQLNTKVTNEMHERFEKLGLSKPKTIRHRAIGIIASEPVAVKEATAETITTDIDNSFLAQCFANIEMIESAEEFNSAIEASNALGGKISKDFVAKVDTICGRTPKLVSHVAVQ
jgi:hypothetical protein